ncbi:elongation of very long chain fatty acids protein 7-like [Tropilaelaps mercedesae]|uniref:Elongation of very long chain fatty acids protein n=1 Tax=Tropilaelaps mercedesae TaxID=418985 RepID=A0A1V9X933_9ACAR|nr:elongation of very long chain fatty acids protein 7-like [Tropilaelaps mercedesae]
MESLDSYVFERDPRLRTWISAQPLSLASIVGAYLYVVYIWGPRFMRDRKPYQLTGVTRAYNLFQIFASAAFAIKIAHHFYGKMGQPFLCSPPDNRRTDALTMELLDMTFYYWWLRVIDFLDTVFFVLRKKQRQITFLHVFHHVIVVCMSWASAIYGLTNLVIFTLCLNSCVHAIMYTYYLLSTLGPAVQKHLWWKKHLTKVQIFQFVLMIAHLSVPMFRNCGYPSSVIYTWQASIGAILLLFLNFYIRSYNSSNSLKNGKPAEAHQHAPHLNGTSKTISTSAAPSALGECVKDK